MIEAERVGALLLTRKQAAAALSISLRKLDELVASGGIVATRPTAHMVRFEPSALNAWVAAQPKSRSDKRGAA